MENNFQGAENAERMCFREFPKKELKIVDLLHYMSNKEVVSVFLDDGNSVEEVFAGRAEDLMYTSEGCLHGAALYPISYIEMAADNTLSITVDVANEN